MFEAPSPWLENHDRLLRQLRSDHPDATHAQLARMLEQRTAIYRSSTAIRKRLAKLGFPPSRKSGGPRRHTLQRRGLFLLEDAARLLEIPRSRLDQFRRSGMPTQTYIQGQEREFFYIRPRDARRWALSHWHRLHGADPEGIAQVFGIPVEEQPPLPTHSPAAVPVKLVRSGIVYPTLAQLCREKGWSLDGARRRLRAGNGRAFIDGDIVERCQAG